MYLTQVDLIGACTITNFNNRLNVFFRQIGG